MNALGQRVAPHGRERSSSTAGRHLALQYGWPQAASLLAALLVAASLAVVGVPLWLSACLGALAGLRAASVGAVRARSRR